VVRTIDGSLAVRRALQVAPRLMQEKAIRKVVPALTTARAGETVSQNAASEIVTESPLYVGWHRTALLR
jgi:hypothetical protein